MSTFSEEIDIKFVQETFEKSFQNPVMKYLHKSSAIMRYFLSTMYVVLQINQSKVGCLFTIYERLQNLLKQRNLPQYTYTQIKFMVVEKLTTVEILTLRTNQSTMKDEVYLKLNIDDLAYTLKDDDIFISCALGVQN